MSPIYIILHSHLTLNRWTCCRFAQSLDEYKRHDINIELADRPQLQQRLLENISKQVTNADAIVPCLRLNRELS